jgi:hypothetical protein
MGAMSFETVYSDYRDSAGLQFAFKKTNLAGGRKTADTLLSKIDVFDAPSSVFKP